MNTSILDRLELATNELHEATKAALALARSQAGALADNDQWTRLPPAGKRCPVSGMSRSSINLKAANGDIRKERRGGMAYYAASDCRKACTK